MVARGCILLIDSVSQLPIFLRPVPQVKEVALVTYSHLICEHSRFSSCGLGGAYCCPKSVLSHLPLANQSLFFPELRTLFVDLLAKSLELGQYFRVIVDRGYVRLFEASCQFLYVTFGFILSLFGHGGMVVKIFQTTARFFDLGKKCNGGLALNRLW